MINQNSFLVWKYSMQKCHCVINISASYMHSESYLSGKKKKSKTSLPLFLALQSLQNYGKKNWILFLFLSLQKCSVQYLAPNYKYLIQLQTDQHRGSGSVNLHYSWTEPILAFRFTNSKFHQSSISKEKKIC